MPEKSIGAVWKKEGKNGEWLSIILDADAVPVTPGSKLNLVAFGNRNKKSDKSPDYWIQPPRGEEGE